PIIPSTGLFSIKKQKSWSSHLKFLCFKTKSSYVNKLLNAPIMNELLTQLQEKMEAFQRDARLQNDKGNKAAGQRA
ncbi:hypothetical protein EVA_22643, partial [gut metagenome]